MRPTNINTIAHQWILEYVNSSSIVIDATVGTGKDTLFLAEHTSKVYAFDIQPEAIHAAQEKTKHFSTIQYICDSHSKLSQYVKEPIDLIVFNLGYYPDGDQQLVTKAETTLEAIKQGYSLLKEKGVILITFYIGHPGGIEEYLTIKEELSSIPLSILDTYTYQDRENAPILYLLQK